MTTDATQHIIPMEEGHQVSEACTCQPVRYVRTDAVGSPLGVELRHNLQSPLHGVEEGLAKAAD